MSAECSVTEMIDLILLHLLKQRLGIMLREAKLLLFDILIHEVAVLWCFHFSKGLILKMLK